MADLLSQVRCAKRSKHEQTAKRPLAQKRLWETYINPVPPRPSYKNHTYLLESWPLMNGFACDTKPPLHIGALRIVISPSGAISGEFLIALSSEETFH